ncbi:MAG TPA: hypothetical protein VIV11_06585 [Kofleriaceae bacterium]
MRWLVVLVLASGVAHAQPAGTPPNQPPQSDAPASDAPAEPTPATVLFQDGRALVEAGKFEEACAKFTASIQLDPDAEGTLLNLGLCNEKLGKTATALGWYRKAQFRSAEAGMTDYEQAAKQQTIVLAAKVPTLRIEAPHGAKVLLDGSEISDVERARVELDPGTHVIEVAGERFEITVREGDNKAIDVRPPPPKRFVILDRGSKQRRNAYLLAGGGGALWIASATLSLIGKSKYDATDHPEQYQRWQNITRFGGTSLFLAGTAAIAGGVYLYVKAPKAERIEQVAPIVGPDQLGVAVAGSF